MMTTINVADLLDNKDSVCDKLEVLRHEMCSIGDCSGIQCEACVLNTPFVPEFIDSNLDVVLDELIDAADKYKIDLRSDDG